MGQSSTVDVTPVTVEQCEQSGPKGPTDAGADQSYWARFLLWLDAYQVQERHPDRVGLMVTFLVLPLAIAYCVIIAFNMMNAPDPVRTEVLWAASEGPFKMPVRCEAAGGCLLSNTIGSKNPECLKLAQKEETDVFIEYSDSFLDGPSILGTVATESTPVVSVLSEVNMAGYPGADEDGTVFKWNPVFQGTCSTPLVVLLIRCTMYGTDMDSCAPSDDDIRAHNEQDAQPIWARSRRVFQRATQHRRDSDGRKHPVRTTKPTILTSFTDNSFRKRLLPGLSRQHAAACDFWLPPADVLTTQRLPLGCDKRASASTLPSPRSSSPKASACGRFAAPSSLPRSPLFLLRSSFSSFPSHLLIILFSFFSFSSPLLLLLSSFSPLPLLSSSSFLPPSSLLSSSSSLPSSLVLSSSSSPPPTPLFLLLSSFSPLPSPLLLSSFSSLLLSPALPPPLSFTLPWCVFCLEMPLHSQSFFFQSVTLGIEGAVHRRLFGPVRGAHLLGCARCRRVRHRQRLGQTQQVRRSNATSASRSTTRSNATSTSRSTRNPVSDAVKRHLDHVAITWRVSLVASSLVRCMHVRASEYNSHPHCCRRLHGDCTRRLCGLILTRYALSGTGLAFGLFALDAMSGTGLAYVCAVENTCLSCASTHALGLRVSQMTEMERQRQRQRQTKRQRQTDRNAERQRDRETDKR
eukprot:2284619-Rhodomonas_salina.2